ncbi:MAG: helix-turn-helix domain-containing protein [Terrimicrobiaceae bacterium]
MPRIIRKALFLKLKELPELCAFQRDFEALSGLPLLLLDELGRGGDEGQGSSPLCEKLQGSAAGRTMCARLRQGLLARSAESPSCVICDAGLQEVAVPVRVSGIPAGFFVFGGGLPHPLDLATGRRIQHLLRHHGIQLSEEQLVNLTEQCPVVAPTTLQAWQRIVETAARHFALRLADQLVDPEKTLSPMVRKACGHIKAHALIEDLTLEGVARHCAVSAGHLSRLFHHATGLTFRAYLAQVRLEHARMLILQTNRNITDIAFESGFNSLSQFHRVFQKVYETSPARLRRSMGVSAVS